MLHVLDALPGTDRRRSARGRAAVAAVRRRADSVRRRVSEHAGPEGATSSPPRSRRARRWASIASSRIPATERYPLALISPASDRTISSTLGELPRPDVKLTMHPDDAAGAGAGGQRSRAGLQRARRGALPLNVTPAIRPGTVSLPKGLWRRSTRNGATGTALVPDTLTDLGGGACFNDARVAGRVARQLPEPRSLTKSRSTWIRRLGRQTSQSVAEEEQQIDAGALHRAGTAAAACWMPCSTLVCSRSHFVSSYSRMKLVWL